MDIEKIILENDIVKDAYNELAMLRKEIVEILTIISGTNKCLLSNCDMLKKQILDMQDIEALDLLTILDRNVDDLTKVNCLIDSLLN